MADPIIRIKRSSVAGKIPTPDQLPTGEIALNTFDGKFYASKNVGIGTTVFAVNPWTVGTGTNTYNTYFTAGNVGIAKTNPTSTLDVNGNANFTGIITASAFVGDGSGLTNIPGGAGGSAIVIKNEGTLVSASSSIVNFVGSGVSAVGAGNTVNVIIDLLGNLDGGIPSSNYGGIESINGGGI